jgi:hypothetical protein
MKLEIKVIRALAVMLPMDRVTAEQAFYFSLFVNFYLPSTVKDCDKTLLRN